MSEIKGLIAEAKIEIDASVEKVWEALVTPEIIKQYMFGTEVASDWKAGSPISWSGLWEGKAYEDKGQILAFDPPRRLKYSHYSPLAGVADIPENYHNVTIELAARDGRTHVVLLQDNNENDEEREHSAANWNAMLAGLKKLLQK